MALRQTTRRWEDMPPTKASGRGQRGIIVRVVVACVALLALLHTAVLLGWVVMHALLGDSRWWSFLLDTFALYLFIPLALIVPLAIVVRSYLLRACALFGAILFLITYGGLFVPPAWRPIPPASAPRLTAMTFNVHVSNTNPDGVVATIRRARADLVGLQEVGPAVAQALHRDLSDLYPYQVTNVTSTSSGAVILSRYPLRPTKITLPGEWNDPPLVARLRFAGATVTVLDAHPVSTLLTRGEIRVETRQRAYTAHVIADFVRAQQDPVLVLSDFNAGDQSTPYDIVTRVLGDAWREKGVGFGHTFPGDKSFDDTRPRVRDWFIPQWLVRIDYVFHSRQWQTVDTRIGPWGGVSDHRPVLATLALTS